MSWQSLKLNFNPILCQTRSCRDNAPDGFSAHHSFRSPTANHPAGGGLAFIHRNDITIQPFYPGIPSAIFVRAPGAPNHIMQTVRDPRQRISPTRSIAGDIPRRFPGCHIHHTGVDQGSGSHLRWSQRTWTRRLLHQSGIAGCDRNARTRTSREVSDAEWSGSLAGPHHHGSIPQCSWCPCCRLWLRFWPSNMILASLDITASGRTNHSVSFSYRPIKNINAAEFESRLRRSTLYSSPSADAESFAKQIEDVVTTTLDEVAPLRTRSRRPPKAVTRWLSDEAVEAKRHRRKLERQWKSSKSEADRYAYRRACRRANKLINASRRDYFRYQLSSAGLQGETESRQGGAPLYQDGARAIHGWTETTLLEICCLFCW